jgi:XTP/dITP diphosphohydrolase
MSTKQQPRRIVLASGNPGKVAEFNALLSDWHWEVLPQSAFAVAEIEEDGDSFVENALLKAHNAAQHSGLPALADDSGLAVDALDGAPGIYSARFAGAAASDADNNHKLLQELQDLPADQRSASFHCALVFLRHWQDPNPIICQARWQGQILAAAAGENGFGYDPLFYVPEQECSAAQLPSELKNRISHRGQALQKLLTALRQEYL